MTQLSRERAKLAVARGLGAGLGGLLLTFIIAPQIQSIAKNTALSAEERADQLQSVFLTTTLAFVALGFALYFLTFLWCKEVVVRIEPRVGHQGHLPHPEEQQAAGNPVRVQLLLPDRPVRRRRRHRLLRDLRARQRHLHHLDDPGHGDRAVRGRPVRPLAGHQVRQEEPLPVLRSVHRHRRRGPVLRPRRACRGSHCSALPSRASVSS